MVGHIYTAKERAADIAFAKAAERERCARVAESTYTNDIGQTGPRPTIQQAIAAAIRNKE